MTRRSANILLLTAVLALVESSDGFAQKKKSKQQPYALLFGTVFNEQGYLVRGARVEVRAKEGKGKWQSQTDLQGEFAVHLPVAKAVYTVEAQAPGMAPDRKEVAFEGEERLDVVLHLKGQ